MNILMVAPPSIRIPPSGYGGVERFLSELIAGLAPRHTIHVVAARGSRFPHPNVVLHEHTGGDYTDFVGQVAREVSFKIDLINIHHEDVGMIQELYSLEIPMVFTCHYTPSSERQREISKYATLLAQSATHQATFDENVPFVLQGIDTDAIPYVERPYPETAGDHPILQRIGRPYAIMVSRMDSRKGQLTAIKACRQAKLPLLLIGAPYRDHVGAEQTSMEYFNRIRRYIDGRWVHHLWDTDVTDPEKHALVGRATASIIPTGFEEPSWKEPFGRVIAESLAAGTPVVSFRDGGTAAEQIDHGVNGYLFSTIDQAVRCLLRIMRIDRAECRRTATERLDLQRFVSDTERFFERYLEEERWNADPQRDAAPV